jgi:DNA-binding CsgD family transcriptional regulator
MQAASGIDVSSDLPQVRAPTLVLHRAGMPQIPLEVSQELADALPNGRLHILTGTSAALFFENVDEVLDAIVGFVSTGAVPQRSSRPVRPPAPDVHGLTARELDVLRLIAGGDTNAEIADRLKVSIHTVERHVANLYRKIDARGRADATAFAVRRGLG